MEKEQRSTAEYKNANKLRNLIEKQQKDFLKRNPDGGIMALDRNLAEQYNKASELANSRMSEIAKKYVDKFLSATLQDLGYADTRGNRKKLRKYWSN